MFSQGQAARYFDQCRDDNEINEVLSGYILSKFLSGADCAQVLRKIHYLCCYLRVTGRSHILRIGEEAFKALSFEAALGGERIGATPAATKPGIEVWNMLRRTASKKYTFSTEPTYGGPGTVALLLKPSRLARLRRLRQEDERPAWLERYFSARCGVLDAIAFALPDYESRRDTLPLYASQEVVEGLETVERLIRETREEEEALL